MNAACTQGTWERRGGGRGDTQAAYDCIKRNSECDDPLRCFIDSKSSCHGQPAEHRQHGQHGQHTAQLASLLECTNEAQAPAERSPGIREPCTTYFAAFAKQCNGKPVSVFGGQLANLANCIANCLLDVSPVAASMIYARQTEKTFCPSTLPPASRCKTCVTLSPATGIS